VTADVSPLLGERARVRASIKLTFQIVQLRTKSCIKHVACITPMLKILMVAAISLKNALEWIGDLEGLIAIAWFGHQFFNRKYS
jgi:hypothetical protein